MTEINETARLEKAGLDAVKWAVAWPNAVKPQCDKALNAQEPRT